MYSLFVIDDTEVSSFERCEDNGRAIIKCDQEDVWILAVFNIISPWSVLLLTHVEYFTLTTPVFGQFVDSENTTKIHNTFNGKLWIVQAWDTWIYYNL